MDGKNLKDHYHVPRVLIPLAVMASTQQVAIRLLASQCITHTCGTKLANVFKLFPGCHLRHAVAQQALPWLSAGGWWDARGQTTSGQASRSMAQSLRIATARRLVCAGGF